VGLEDELTTILAGLSPEDRALLQEFVDVEAKLIPTLQKAGVSTYRPFPHQERFHRLESNNRWLIGGNRMGKSTALEQEVLWFVKANHPYRKVPRSGDVWCCCPGYQKSQDFQIPGIVKVLGPLVERVVHKPNPTLITTNGRRVIFKTYEQAAMKFASEEPVLVALDEEPPWDIMEEIYVRRSARHDLNIVGGVTPVFGLTWLYDKVINKGWQEAQWVGGKTTDNPLLPKKEMELLDKGLTGVMRRIRFLGEILPIGGSMVFDPERLEKFLRGAVEAPWQFDYDGPRWIQVDEGPLKIWRFPEPDEKEEFVLGCDPAEGLNTSHSDAEPVYDETSVHVKSRNRHDIVAEFVSGIAEPDFTGEFVLPSISDVFNGAKMNIERNNHGHTVIAFAKRRYPSRLWIAPENQTDVTYDSQRRYGYYEQEHSRRYLVDMLRRAIREDARYKIPSAKAIRQMLTFVIKATGRTSRMEHQEGSKDDCVFSLGLCEVLDQSLSPPRVLTVRTDKSDLRDLARKRKPGRAVDWYTKF
jgi:phage terminase large subunit-like protein